MGRDAEAGKLVPKYIIPVKTWWFVVALLAVMVVVSYGRVLMITNNHDFAVYFKAAVALREGRDIYADLVPFKEAMESGEFDYKAEDTVWPYSPTPVLAILLLPLSYLPYAWASVIWAALNVIALGLGCWLILLSQGKITPPRLSLALLLLCGFRPALVGLRLGQMDVIIFLAVALSFYLLKRGREGWAGALLGLAIATKFFAAILVGYLLWKRRWRPVLWAGAVALALIVGSYAVVGFDTIPGYVEFTSLYSIGGFVAYPYHMCFNAFFTRALTDNLFAQPVRGMNLPWLANGLTLLCSGVVIIVSCLITWGSGDPRERRFGLEYGLVVAAILLVMPPAPLYMYTWLLLPFIVLGVQMGEEERLSLWWPLLMALSYVIVARDYRYNIPIVIRFLQSHYLFGGLALWCILVAWLRQHPAKPQD